MIIQPPCNEAARLDALRRYQILYTAPEEVFDSLTRLAAAICGTPIAVISLIDEQRLWFKSKVGFSKTEIARDQASCIHAAIQGSGEIFIVPDTLLDERFSNNLLVTAKPHVRFFAGVPLRTAEGHALGTLCVMDLVPRELNDDQQEALRALTQEVLVHFELRRKNLQLQPIRERLDLILNATGEGIYGLDADGLTTFINPAAVRMLGWTAEELLGRPLHELLHHTSPAEYCPLDAGFKDSRLHQVDDAVFLRKDGTGFPVAYTSSPITQDGMQLGMAVIFQDITKRKQLEDLAEKKQQFLDVLLDNLEEGLVACDADGILTLFNSATRRFTGLLEQPIPPEQWAEYYNVYAPDGKTLMRTEELPLYRALHGEIVHNAEFVIAPKHGPARTLCANGQALFDAHGKKLGAVIAMRNITETQRIEQELRENEERYRTLYDDNPAMYFTLDADGKILLVNARGAEQLGYTVEELIGQPVLNVFYEGDKETVLKEFKACLQRPGEIAQWEFRKVRKGGSIIWVNETVRPIISGNGDIIVLVVCENINDRKLAEAQLIYAANYDALTNLPNRTLLYDRLGQAVVRVPWNKRLVAVLFLDIDRFKLINDTLGHSIADLLLSAIGERLTACVREGDTVARLGGDEFAVILADVARLKDVTLVAEKVLASLALPYDLDGQEVFTSASIGISLCPND
ncbi:MAG: PAS domain S-box protein, partial [Gammaproteobacteria bacterium]